MSRKYKMELTGGASFLSGLSIDLVMNVEAVGRIWMKTWDRFVI